METTQAVDDTQTSDLSDLEPIPNAGDLADHDLSARFVQPELVGLGGQHTNQLRARRVGMAAHRQYVLGWVA